VRPDAEGASGTVTVETAGPHGMVTVRGDLTSSTLGEVVSEITGIAVPGRGEARFEDAYGILWMAPDELLVFCPYGEVAESVTKMEAGLEGLHVLVADVSDARSVFTVSGAGIRDVLAKLTPADVSPEEFGIGMVRRSRLAQIPAAFWLRDGATVTVICFRSVAGYALDLLSTAATPGSEVRYF